MHAKAVRNEKLGMLEQVERGIESLNEARMVGRRVVPSRVEFENGTGVSYRAHLAIAPERPANCVAELFKFPEKITGSISVPPHLNEESMFFAGRGRFVDHDGLCMPQLYYEEEAYVIDGMTIGSVRIDHPMARMNAVTITVYPSVTVAEARVKDGGWWLDEYVPICLIKTLQPSFSVEKEILEREAMLELRK